jgi:UDP-N-acetylmuramoylalanine--D-glutamate ligase
MTFEVLANEGLSARYDSMASRVGPRINELRKQFIRESFSTIHQVEHRLELVAMVHGKEFINDSISVTVNSTWWALESNNKPIVWIVGGVENGKDYKSLSSLVSRKVKAIVCLGLDNRRIHDAYDDLGIPMVDTTSMEDAVQLAYLMSEKGDVILLSPVCASFDLFENYEERGIAFRKAVKQL